MDTGEEFRDVESEVGDLVPVGALDPGDEAAGFQPTQVVGHLPGGHRIRVERPSFRLFGAPLTSYFVLAFLAFVLVTMGFSETGQWVLGSLLIIVPLLIVGWHRS